MITYNGNEMMLQNDMGNTLIQDSKTGHIMGLSEGFVPVGLKEHGGIMYIASVNKEGKGEIGTIPSPILYIEDESIHINSFQFSLIEKDSYPKEQLTILDGYKLYPGDKFLIDLSLNINPEEPLNFKDFFKYQYVSTVTQKGLVDIELFTICNNNPYKLDSATQSCQEFIDQTGDVQHSPYWFINNVQDLSLDAQKTYMADLFKTYPGNFPPGQLGIRAVLNTIDYFDFIEIEQDLGIEKFNQTAPKIIKDSDTGQLYVQFVGFQFRTSSGRFVGSVELALSEQKSHLEIPLTELNQTEWEWKPDNEAWHIYLNVDNKGVTAPVKYDTWYQVTVKQYDQYNGYIDTFTYSFNPKYLLNGIETSARWSAIEYYPQKAHISENDKAQIEIYPASSPSSIKSAQETINISLDASHVWFYDTQDIFHPAFDSTPTHIDFKSANMSVPLPDDRISYLYDKINSIDIDIQVNGSLMSVGYSGSNTINVDFPVTQDLKVCINGNPCEIGTGTESYPCSLQSYEVIGDQWYTLPNDSAVTYKFTDPVIKFADIISVNRNDFNVELNQLTISNLPISVDLPINVPLKGSSAELGEGDKESGFSYQKFELGEGDTTSELRFPDITYFAKAQTVNNLSPYTICPWFELRGDYNEYADIPIGFNKYGELKPAMHFDTNCIGYLDKDTTQSIVTSIALNSDSIGYYPSAGETTMILSKGSYLIIMNRKGLVNPQLKITINNTNLSCTPSIKLPNGGYCFVPQLLYLPEDSTVKIEWSNIDKLKNIGVFLVNDLIEVKSGKWETESPKIVNYNSEELITEIILPVCASYYEDVQFNDSLPFNYYTGTKYDYQIDYALIYDKDADRVCKKDFVYKYNNENPLESQIDSIDGVEGSITYRFKN